MSEKINFCVIGVRRMGCRHIQAAQMPGFNLLGIYDSQATSLKRVSDEFGICRSYILTFVSKLNYF